MSYENGIVTKPINTADISQAVGYASGDIGTLIEKGRINMWAKNKPIKVNTPRDVSEEDRRKKGYGVINSNIYTIDEIEESDNWESILELASSDNAGWVYDRPDGKPYYYRFNDFHNYNKNAINPFYFKKIEGNNYNAVFQVGQVADIPDFNMSVADIISIIGLDSAEYSGYGFIYSRKKDGYTKYYHIPAINDEGTGINYPLSTTIHNVTLGTIPGEYKVCAYILDYNRGNIVLIPASAITMTVLEAIPKVVLVASMDTSSAKYKFTYKITANEAIDAGIAILYCYNASGKSIFDLSIDIGALSANGYVEDTITIEEDLSTLDSWEFSYMGTSVNGSV